MDSQYHTRECKYYDWCFVRREEVQQKSSAMPLDFYNTCNPREFCDWIVHLNYYFDLYELLKRLESGLLRILRKNLFPQGPNYSKSCFIYVR